MSKRLLVATRKGLFTVNRGKISIGVSCGGVWVSRDAGAQWDCVGKGWRSDYLPPELLADPAIQDVHRLAQCGAHPEALWVQHHNGIFRSEDSGESWQCVSSHLPPVYALRFVEGGA